jgi:hypothetical protein
MSRKKYVGADLSRPPPIYRLFVPLADKSAVGAINRPLRVYHSGKYDILRWACTVYWRAADKRPYDEEVYDGKTGIFKERTVEITG